MMEVVVEEHSSGVVFLVIVGLDVDLILVYESMGMLEKRDFLCIHHERLWRKRRLKLLPLPWATLPFESRSHRSINRLKTNNHFWTSDLILWCVEFDRFTESMLK
jgi:hypothetical protein